MTAQSPAPPPPPPPLAGMTVVVTRPRGQAERLIAMLEQAGGAAIFFPVIEIAPLEDDSVLKAQIAKLASFDLAIFISPSAVNAAMPMIAGSPPLPRLRFAAVGPGTARELKRFGIEEIIAPQRGGDSEALLAMAEMVAARGKRIVIFRGTGGRELLRESLAKRGATVEIAECYRRLKPKTSIAPLIEAWQRDRLHAIIATSSEGLKNLVAIAGKDGRALLETTPLFVPHPRIAETAHDLGMQAILTEAGDEGLLRGVIAWREAASADSFTRSRL